MRSLVVLLALLLLLPFVQAGTQAEPEIMDSPPVLDAAYGATRGDTTLDAPEIDLVAAWFSANDTTVGVTWQVVNESHRLQEREVQGFGMTFLCGATHLYAEADLGGPYRSPIGLITGWNDIAPVTVEGDFIHAEFPRSAFDAYSCTVLTHTLASSILAISTTNPNFWSGGGNLWWRDRAPDVGFGRDFALT